MAPVSGQTDGNGLASAEWTLGDVVGGNTVRASAAGFNATFSATGVAGPPVTLTRNAGNNQSAPVGAAVAVDPVVLVKDANGNPVAGVSVGFAVAAGGGSIQLASNLTNSQGLASGGTWTLGPAAGQNSLTATAPGLAGSPATFFATGTPTNGPPASMVVVSGDAQTGVVGRVLADSLVVQVLDAGGTGVPGAPVTWTILGGGGSVSTTTVNTDIAGVAWVRWTLGNAAGANQVEAATGGLTRVFSATGTAGSASQLVLAAAPGNGQSGVSLPQQPALGLADGFGNPVSQAGIPVTAAIASGGGTLGGALTVATDGAGIAQFTDLAISGLVGARTLLFSSGGLAGITSGPVTITAGPAAILAKQGGDNQSAPAGTPVAINPRVLVTDASGNTVAGVSVSFAVTGGGGSIAFATDVSNANGRASGGTWTLGAIAGANALTATAPGLNGSPAVFTATGTSSSGPPAAIINADGDSQVGEAGTVLADSLVVQVVDGNSNGVPGVLIAWTVLSGGGSLSSGSSTTDPSGLAAVTWTLGNLAGQNTVRASGAGFTTTFTATGSAGPAAVISRQAGDNQTATAGTPVPIDPVVLVQDAHGNPVGGVTVSFAVTGGGGSIVSGTAITSPQGTATGGAWILGPLAGTNLLRASSAGLGGSPLTFTATGTAAANLRIPLIDMGSATYFGLPGGLYPAGNTVPAAHATAGAARARNIRPRSFNGNPNSNGKFVLLSIGLSNTTQEWCSAAFDSPCDSWTLMGRAATDPQVNHVEMVLANGARPGQEASTWESPTDFNYDLVRDSILVAQGLSERQVEAIWLKVFNGNPTTSLPSNQADAERLVGQYGNILRALKVRYPNLQMVFFSSRTYGGYATSPLNPEPYAYETGYAVKWVIEAQIDQMANGGTVVDARAGNLNYNTVAPWVGWGPYPWADGLNPRSDGLTWSLSDFEADHTHPARPGETKVANMLLNFFKTDARASCWFLAGQTCP